MASLSLTILYDCDRFEEPQFLQRRFVFHTHKKTCKGSEISSPSSKTNLQQRVHLNLCSASSYVFFPPWLTLPLIIVNNSSILLPPNPSAPVSSLAFSNMCPAEPLLG